MPRIRFRLAWKIVFPFAVLSLVVGAVGTYVASNELGSRARSSFDAQLIHDGFSASSVLQSSDGQRRTLVKSLAASPAIQNAWAKPADLQAALERALAGHPSVVVESVDPKGREIIGISSHGEAAASVTQNLDLSGWTGFQPLLSGRVTQLAFVGPETDPVAFDARVVRDHIGTLLGTLLVGQPVSDLGAQLKAVSHDEITFFDGQGAVLGTTLATAPPQWPGLALDPSLRSRVTNSNVVERPVSATAPAIELLIPWTSAPDSLGYLGVAASSAGLQADTERLRLLMAIISVLGVVLTLLVGVLVARRIIHPVHELLEATRLISAGDLAHRAPVTSRDEIGELTESFNAMTQTLQARSGSLTETMARLRDTYLMTMEALAAAVEARDAYTHGHTERVASYARVLAESLGLKAPEMEALQRACILHDIGKIGVEDQILRKQGRLDPEEELRMQRHPQIAVEMLKGIDFLDPVLPIIRAHHERWDGNGYPDQLHADDIPLGARILAVADALDAMTSDRSYRRARTFEHAKAEILNGSATHFDPEVVTAFIKSQQAIESLLNESAVEEGQPHPEPGDLQGWRLHVVGR